MGLDTTHGCWNGSYGKFNIWRNALAEAAGYTFFKHGFGGESPNMDWGNIEATIGVQLDGKWPAIPVRPDGTPDPLIILLAHSDCDGELSQYLDQIADRIEELIPALKDFGAFTTEWMVEKSQQFVKGLRRAHKRGQKVGFH